MPTNDFVPVATDPGANVDSQQSFVSWVNRTKGFQSGIVPSPTFNKVLRQSSFMSALLAQFIVDELTVDNLDDGNFAAALTRLKQAIAVVATNATPSGTFASATGLQAEINTRAAADTNEATIRANADTNEANSRAAAVASEASARYNADVAEGSARAAGDAAVQSWTLANFSQRSNGGGFARANFIPGDGFDIPVSFALGGGPQGQHAIIIVSSNVSATCAYAYYLRMYFNSSLAVADYTTGSMTIMYYVYMAPGTTNTFEGHVVTPGSGGAGWPSISLNLAVLSVGA